jgi:5-methylcytosine-specific restriction endonuclease McrA
MRPQVPDGDLGAIIEAAVTEKLERLEARRFAATSRPRTHLSTTDTSPASRRIPAAVRRAVHARDGGRCRYVDTSGRRCEERHHLEYHHLHPFAFGGDHRPENVHLTCRAHNAWLAKHDYGRETIDRFRRPGRPESPLASGARSRAKRAATVSTAGTTGGPARVAPRGS